MPGHPHLSVMGAYEIGRQVEFICIKGQDFLFKRVWVTVLP